MPPYAPELNPVEECWNHTKYADLPNMRMSNLVFGESLASSSKPIGRPSESIDRLPGMIWAVNTNGTPHARWRSPLMDAAECRRH
ncbi:MAG: hypothetical protein JXB62_04600 [Pirellulales bacterium]|nr:hypothetical protein [Pirellulales bacterium]